MKKNSVFKHELFFTIVRITITPLLIIAFFSAMTFAHSLPAQELLAGDRNVGSGLLRLRKPTLDRRAGRISPAGCRFSGEVAAARR